jgi:hypothetical protein
MMTLKTTDDGTKMTESKREESEGHRDAQLLFWCDAIEDLTSTPSATTHRPAGGKEAEEENEFDLRARRSCDVFSFPFRSRFISQ